MLVGWLSGKFGNVGGSHTPVRLLFLDIREELTTVSVGCIPHDTATSAILVGIRKENVGGQRGDDTSCLDHFRTAGPRLRGQSASTHGKPTIATNICCTCKERLLILALSA